MNTSFFGAPPISLDQLGPVEQSAPNLILWAVPFMILFTAIEMIAAYVEEKPFYERKETVGSVLVGLGALAVGAATKLALLYAIVWIYNALPWRMELAWWTLLPCYVIFDFFSYWAHRISHEQRFWWATHVVHHSGEHYNLSVSFRLSWVQHLKIIFFLPVALIGFHPVIFFTTNQIAVLFQFWVHTEYIGKLPRWVEYVFATPSNHRVHHGSQPKYIDKNYGATFIFWDRLFGTYQPEEERPIYGITTNIEQKGNPFHINFHEFADMARDVKKARGLRQKLFYVFGSPIKIAETKQAGEARPEPAEMPSVA
ncbi:MULTISPECIES: sterol desaturase family protein [Spirosoma]|uniref:Sterol desaturase family protein n=1 Tax=Spirosoma sordidisoli TaxID=2502893 RepID=A0A4Q2UEA6_9BACT|nr:MULTISPECIES: sterol desaturase family protein [Spirosoma]RYC67078.1 sterol desaturase family protein [Spirosoma sordidisoli]RYC67206.1 sterol desaturase family protein [Spirosoma sordidisoli]